MERKAVDVRELLERLNADARLRQSTHFSDTVYRDEPILRTGRQMKNYLPDRYREMRAISRYRTEHGHGRWLSEAELFYRQARAMEDFEDDCPYHGRFAAYFPTYNSMSDRQLRGYFTWRAAVRAGDVQETCLSFAFIYVYELLCGIGATDPADGFAKLKRFWEAYRAFDTGLDRSMRTWLRDYVVYHGLDPALVADDPALAQDRALVALVERCAPFDPALAAKLQLTRGDRDEASVPQNAEQTLPLPPDTALEQELIDAVDELSSYRIKNSKLYRDHPDDLRHVACAIFVRMLAYYRKHRAQGYVENSFGEVTELSYTMFASAVFFSENQHEDATVALTPIRTFRCERGRWTCRRFFGGQGRSTTFGDMLRAVDRKLRQALDYAPPLKERPIPKYLDRLIDREIDTWLTWKRDHAPRVIEIDVTKLQGIRTAAAQTREALLIDEEREDAPQAPAPTAAAAPQPVQAADAEMRPAPSAAPAPVPAPQPVTPPAPAPAPAPAATSAPLDATETAFLRAIAQGDSSAAQTVARDAGTSADMLVDRVNEALFDLVGDTVIEFGGAGPELVEDYRDDVEGLIGS